MCNCTLIPVTSTKQCESFTRQSKNMERLLEEYLQMKVKRLFYFNGIRTQMVLERPAFSLTQCLQLLCFTVFRYVDISNPEVCRQPKLKFLQMKIFIKETDFTNSSLISSFFIEILKRNSFSREFWIEDSIYYDQRQS